MKQNRLGLLKQLLNVTDIPESIFLPSHFGYLSVFSHFYAYLLHNSEQLALGFCKLRFSVLLEAGFLLNSAKKESLMGDFKVEGRKNNSGSGSESMGS